MYQKMEYSGSVYREITFIIYIFKSNNTGVFRNSFLDQFQTLRANFFVPKIHRLAFILNKCIKLFSLSIKFQFLIHFRDLNTNFVF